MAIINSNAIGAGRKSAGTITYRRSRGRTIASQRVISNKSRTTAQVSQRFLFGYAGAISKFGRPAINLSYERSKYGSHLNKFVSENWAALREAAETYRNTGSQLNAITPEYFGMFIQNNAGSMNFAVGSLSGSVTQTSQMQGSSYSAQVYEGLASQLGCVRVGVNTSTGAISIASIQSADYASAGITVTTADDTGIISIECKASQVTVPVLNEETIYFDVWKMSGKILTSNAFIQSV